MKTFVFCVVLWLCSVSLNAQVVVSANPTTYQTTELKLLSAKQYRQPVTDVELNCMWTHESGRTVMLAGFWNGGQDNREYRVRFAPPLAGVWTYTTNCSDTSNSGLHRQQGSIRVQAYQGANPLYAKGFLKVSDNKRYLSYANGEPFFWLGDTAWEMVWKARWAEVQKYVADRAAKKFSVVQMVPMSHLAFERGTGIHNRNGATYFLDSDYAKPNPRYFDYLDSIVQGMNNAGIVAVMSPLWATMSEYHIATSKYENYLTRAQALAMARYIAARYAGAHVAWIVGGDQKYETSAQKNFWADFGRTLKTASGGQQLTTVHSDGFTASFDFFDNSTEWLDFQMYQSAHVAHNDFVWNAAQRGYNLLPIKPLIDGEPAYEAIPNEFWSYADTAKRFPIRAEHVRRNNYEAILGGSIIGVSYGANGIWQWNTLEMPTNPSITPFIDSADYVDSALQYPGAFQMTYLREWMERVKWHTMSPQNAAAVKFTTTNALFDPPTNYIASMQSDSMTVAFFPQKIKSATVNLPRVCWNQAGMASWVNPSTGRVERQERINAGLTNVFAVDNTSDWLLVVHSVNESALLSVFSGVVEVPALLLTSFFPQPANGNVTLNLEAKEAGTVTVEVFDMTGRLLNTLTQKVLRGLTAVPLSLPATGAFPYRCSFSGEGASKEHGLFSGIVLNAQ
jgi:hypothetical protein